MNQFKSIVTKLHGENKAMLRELYVDKHVYIESVSSSEQPVEDERIYSYHELSFRFVGTGIRHPERMNLYVFIPLRVTENKEISCYIPWEDYLLRLLSPRINKLSQDWENDRKDSREKARCECQTVNSRVLRRNGLVFDSQRQEFVLKILFHMPLINGTIINAKSGYKAVRSVMENIEFALQEIDRTDLQKHMETYRHQMEIKKWLQTNRKTAFIANGSILPRQGDSELPMTGAVAFVSPPDLQETLILSDGTRLAGMAIPEGVTVITGGGYSGKSTLLDALEQGIYHHIPGDGREYVISIPSSTKIYAEDGRPISDTDLTLFFREQCTGLNFKNFSTNHASGSVSQAANILEAIYAGSRLLLIDEDTSATNFMIRDALIRRLVSKEPIIPFTDRVRSIYAKTGISTILIIGGSGEYLQHADLCLLMEDYQIQNVTEVAKELVGGSLKGKGEEETEIPLLTERYWNPKRNVSDFCFSRCVSVDYARYIQIDRFSGDMTRLTALVSEDQLHTIAFLLTYCLNNRREKPWECREMAAELTKILFEPEIIDHVQSENYQFTLWFEEIRPMDLLAALFRMRGCLFKEEKDS